MDGYAKLAALMGEQDEFAIFRGFRTLGMQNLLYMQAEIVHLEEELQYLVRRDAAHSERQFHSKDWWSLSQGESEGDTDQWIKVLEIRKRLDKYYESLLKQASISQLGKPRQYDLRFLREWLERPSMGAFPLLGLDRRTWETGNESDLVAVRARNPPDVFSSWFSERMVPLYHRFLGKKVKTPICQNAGAGIYNYEESALQRLFEISATVVASIIPICSVAVLYFVQSNGIRLGLIAAFSALFSLALCLMSRARNIEVFAATAAFAAVNVVFLTSGSCQTGQESIICDPCGI